MTNFQKLTRDRNAIHEIARRLTETNAQLRLYGDANLTAAADEVQDAYAALMEAAWCMSAALQYEKASRS